MSVYSTTISEKCASFEDLNVFHIFDKARNVLNGLLKNMTHTNEVDSLALAFDALNNAELDLLQVMRSNRGLARRRTVSKRAHEKKRYL